MLGGYDPRRMMMAGGQYAVSPSYALNSIYNDIAQIRNHIYGAGAGGGYSGYGLPGFQDFGSMPRQFGRMWQMPTLPSAPIWQPVGRGYGFPFVGGFGGGYGGGYGGGGNGFTDPMGMGANYFMNPWSNPQGFGNGYGNNNTSSDESRYIPKSSKKSKAAPAAVTPAAETPATTTPVAVTPTAATPAVATPVVPTPPAAAVPEPATAPVPPAPAPRPASTPASGHVIPPPAPDSVAVGLAYRNNIKQHWDSVIGSDYGKEAWLINCAAHRIPADQAKQELSNNKDSVKLFLSELASTTNEIDKLNREIASASTIAEAERILSSSRNILRTLNTKRIPPVGGMGKLLVDLLTKASTLEADSMSKSAALQAPRVAPPASPPSSAVAEPAAVAPVAAPPAEPAAATRADLEAYWKSKKMPLDNKTDHVIAEAGRNWIASCLAEKLTLAAAQKLLDENVETIVKLSDSRAAIDGLMHDFKSVDAGMKRISDDPNVVTRMLDRKRDPKDPDQQLYQKAWDKLHAFHQINIPSTGPDFLKAEISGQNTTKTQSSASLQESVDKLIANYQAERSRRADAAEVERARQDALAKAAPPAPAPVEPAPTPVVPTDETPAVAPSVAVVEPVAAPAAPPEPVGPTEADLKQQYENALTTHWYGKISKPAGKDEFIKYCSDNGVTLEDAKKLIDENAGNIGKIIAANDKIKELVIRDRGLSDRIEAESDSTKLTAMKSEVDAAFKDYSAIEVKQFADSLPPAFTKWQDVGQQVERSRVGNQNTVKLYTTTIDNKIRFAAAAAARAVRETAALSEDDKLRRQLFDQSDFTLEGLEGYKFNFKFNEANKAKLDAKLQDLYKAHTITKEQLDILTNPSSPASARQQVVSADPGIVDRAKDFSKAYFEWLGGTDGFGLWIKYDDQTGWKLADEVEIHDVNEIVAQKRGACTEKTNVLLAAFDQAGIYAKPNYIYDNADTLHTAPSVVYNGNAEKRVFYDANHSSGTVLSNYHRELKLKAYLAHGVLNAIACEIGLAYKNQFSIHIEKAKGDQPAHVVETHDEARIRDLYEKISSIMPGEERVNNYLANMYSSCAALADRETKNKDEVAKWSRMAIERDSRVAYYLQFSSVQGARKYQVPDKFEADIKERLKTETQRYLRVLGKSRADNESRVWLVQSLLNAVGADAKILPDAIAAIEEPEDWLKVRGDVQRSIKSQQMNLLKLKTDRNRNEMWIKKFENPIEKAIQRNTTIYDDKEEKFAPAIATIAQSSPKSQ